MDKFLAHLDDLNEMIPPFLDQARAAIDFYHRYVVDESAAPVISSICRLIWQITTGTALMRRTPFISRRSVNTAAVNAPIHNHSYANGAETAGQPREHKGIDEWG